MKRIRVPALLLAGLLLISVVSWRERQLAAWRGSPRTSSTQASRRLAPHFELADHQKHIVKLGGLLGRERVILLFFDASTEILDHPLLAQLIAAAESPTPPPARVLAIGTATPATHQLAARGRGKPLPFPLLSDIDPTGSIPLPAHHAWASVDPRTQAPRPALFLIERDGRVPVDDAGKPVPVDRPEVIIETLAQGRWPTE